MRCSKIKNLALDYVDGVLPENVREEVKVHIAKCAGCASLIALINENTAILKSAPRVEAPQSLWRGISERIEEMKRPSPFVLWLEEVLEAIRPYAIPAVSFALIVAASALIISRGDIFKKTKVTYVDVAFEAAGEMSFYVSEHRQPDNSAVSQGEMSALSKAMEEGI